jgi:chemotaxis protein MotB
MLADTETAPEASEGGENYFVSMTDMMVGMLFLFIILLMVFALNYRVSDDDSKRIRECLEKVVRQNAQLSDDIEKKVDSIQGDVGSRIAALDYAMDQRKKLMTSLQEELQRERTPVEIDPSNGVLRLTEQSVRFESNQSFITPLARGNIERIARALSNVVPRYAACRKGDPDQTCKNFQGPALETIFIEGNTDSTGIDEANWRLSTDRANATYRELIAAYPDLTTFENRNHQELVSVSGYSSMRPIDPAQNPSAFAKNRRIDLRFVMEAENTINYQKLLGLNDQIRNQLALLARVSAESVEKCK